LRRTKRRPNDLNAVASEHVIKTIRELPIPSCAKTRPRADRMRTAPSKRSEDTFASGISA
jgi:hypothetical protein